MTKLFAIALLTVLLTVLLTGCGMDAEHALDAQSAAIMQSNTDQLGYDQWMRLSPSIRLYALQQNVHKFGITYCGEGTSHDDCDEALKRLDY